MSDPSISAWPRSQRSANVRGEPASTQRVRATRYGLAVLILSLLALATSLTFSLTDLDVRIARLFSAALASGGGHWTWEANRVVGVLYHYGTWPVLLVAASLLVVLAVRRTALSPGAVRGVLFILMSLVLGPGLLVNVVGKDHWGRPRPRDLVEFGGHQLYAAPGLINTAGSGKSFPCGHSSMGFALGVSLALVLWRTHRRTALACLGMGIMYGTALGLARMGVGAHFLSDVLWSAYVPALVALLLWWWVRPDSPQRPILAQPLAQPLAGALATPAAELHLAATVRTVA